MTSNKPGFESRMDEAGDLLFDALSDDDFCPPLKKLHLTKNADARFSSPPKGKLEQYQKSFCPENTKVNTRWATKNFRDWQTDYNCRHPSDPCPDDILLSDSTSNLAKWLQIYAVSTRKKNGEKYPAKTVYLLLCGLQRYMKENKKHPFNIFDRDHPDFKLVVCTCDNYFRELRDEGVGAGSHATEILTPDDE